MHDSNVFLDEVRIKNYLSLRDVSFSLKPLTILVGPNASGKSNVLSALRLLAKIVFYGELPTVKFIQGRQWAREANPITFKICTQVEGASTTYELELRADPKNLAGAESLSVKNFEVISIQDGTGYVREEDGSNETTFRSKNLALTSAGNYGHKPITSELTQFISNWEFYDFRPWSMRLPVSRREQAILEESRESGESPPLDDRGSILSGLLSYWYDKERDCFSNVSESLANCTNISLGQCTIDGEEQICLLEGYEKPIPLSGASDGTLRLVAYFAILNQPDTPPLIAIEEPERNLHPGALKEIADVLERIAEESQVIVTTHSIQLLDAFESEDLFESLGVLLLRKLPGQGTEVINLENILHDREALKGWIDDFGIGSGIYESELLQDLMEEPACRA